MTQRLTAKVGEASVPIYFDNAATSWPKPAEVQKAVAQAISSPLGNPGRSGHRMSIAAANVVLEAREALAELLGASDPAQLVLTKNATEALNVAILGIAGAGGHVIATSMEHNSVMRPLRYRESQGTDLTVLQCSPEGMLDPVQVRQAIRPTTRLVVTTHASNVAGTLMPIEGIAQICRELGVPYLVDAAQTAGVYPIRVEEAGIDLLAVAGHKGLLGPTGTGGLYIREGLEPAPLLRGGTGSRSDQESQPEFLPDRFESGTLNVLGLAGLAAGVRHVLGIGINAVREHEKALVKNFVDKASAIPGCSLYGPKDPERQTATVSFNLDGVSPSEVGHLLDAEFGVMCRAGLHCAPSAHRTLGTFPSGTVRFSWGLFNTVEEIDYVVEALQQISTWSRAARR